MPVIFKCEVCGKEEPGRYKSIRLPVGSITRQIGGGYTSLGKGNTHLGIWDLPKGWLAQKGTLAARVVCGKECAEKDQGRSERNVACH